MEKNDIEKEDERERGKERREEETFLNLEKIEYTLFRENYFCEENNNSLENAKGSTVCSVSFLSSLFLILNFQEESFLSRTFFSSQLRGTERD